MSVEAMYQAACLLTGVVLGALLIALGRASVKAGSGLPPIQEPTTRVYVEPGDLRNWRNGMFALGMPKCRYCGDVRTTDERACDSCCAKRKLVPGRPGDDGLVTYA